MNNNYNPQPTGLYYDSNIDPRNLFPPTHYPVYSSPSPLSYSHSPQPSQQSRSTSPYPFVPGPSPVGASSPWPAHLSPPGSASSHSSYTSSAHSHASPAAHSNQPPLVMAARRTTATKTVAFKASTLDDLVEGSHSDGKPEYSVKTLCEHAILGSRKGKLTLNEIVEACAKRYPYFEDAEAKRRLRNSARHDLSQDTRFVKVKRSLLEPGRGTFWAYNPAVQPADTPMSPQSMTTSRSAREVMAQPSTLRRPSVPQPVQAPLVIRRQSVPSPHVIKSNVSHTFPQHYTLNPNAGASPIPTGYSTYSPQVLLAQQSQTSHAAVRFQPYSRRVSSGQAPTLTDSRLY
ncbi:hypothetical protein FRB93_004650 [Tulasnella sp. JGI-2019a]|nr:hypothetical protein FRB93_004650 [Tulasnella sp. JGI-2019a]